MVSMDKEVERELLPFLRIYKDGSVERLSGSPIVPPSPEGDPATGTLSKDITISSNPPISARIYLPKDTKEGEKLPVLVYYHGGAFCFESAFSLVETKFLNCLVSQARAVAVSIEYRLAPEQPLPVLYQDCFSALKWVASHSPENNNLSVKNPAHLKAQAETTVPSEPWLNDHADFGRLYIGGDSAGANLAYNVAVRAAAAEEGLPGGVKILGTFLTHPYFWGSEAVGEEPSEEREEMVPSKIWEFLYPDAEGGIDNPAMNPVAGSGVPKMGGSRLMVSVAGEDELRSRGAWFCEGVKKSGWNGEVELVQVEGEVHAFHILNYESESAKKLIARLASFLK